MQDGGALPPHTISGNKAAVPVGIRGGGRRSVGESLAGLFPAAGGAPHVAVLHPVHLTALLPFTAHLPTVEGRTQDNRDGDNWELLHQMFRNWWLHNALNLSLNLR